MAEKLDPFDVAALEKSVNDSAVRVSTIWVSYLVFGLYLVIAAGNVTHRQLFLEEPIKLPVLNIDLPLIGFFFLAPILFVVFHAYVLIQVLLLSRTAAAYNEALAHSIKVASDDARLRQRLANTLFAQIFAGSPREREGWIGWLLRLMAWITLAIAPACVLLVFQFEFLPYHSRSVTWGHRVLLMIDLLTVLLLWPGVLAPRLDIGFGNVWRQTDALTVAATLIAFSSLVLSFPGEPHARWTRFDVLRGANLPRPPAECALASVLTPFFETFDRLWLPGVDVVDDEKLAKIEAAGNSKQQQPHLGERTRNFQGRDLSCGKFSAADLRRVDLSGAKLFGADFEGAELQGAKFDRASLERADFSRAQMQGASFDRTDLRGARLFSAQLQEAQIGSGANLREAFLWQADLQRANLAEARLQGIDLGGAHLQGANLDRAHLQGANLFEAQLQGASLDRANLRGASLRSASMSGAVLNEAKLEGASLASARLEGASLAYAWLWGAVLDHAELPGASLEGARLHGASLISAKLQGADLTDTRLDGALLFNAELWRAWGASCTGARIVSPQFAAIPGYGNHNSTAAITDKIGKLIESVVGKISGREEKDSVRDRMRTGLLAEARTHDAVAVEKFWRDCEAESKKISQAEYEQKHAELLLNLICRIIDDQEAIVVGMIQRWISDEPHRREFSARLARGLLGQNGEDCPATKDLGGHIKEFLQKRAS